MVGAIYLHMIRSWYPPSPFLSVVTVSRTHWYNTALVLVLEVWDFRVNDMDNVIYYQTLTLLEILHQFTFNEIWPNFPCQTKYSTKFSTHGQNICSVLSSTLTSTSSNSIIIQIYNEKYKQSRYVCILFKKEREKETRKRYCYWWNVRNVKIDFSLKLEAKVLVFRQN